MIIKFIQFKHNNKIIYRNKFHYFVSVLQIIIRLWIIYYTFLTFEKKKPNYYFKPYNENNKGY